MNSENTPDIPLAVLNNDIKARFEKSDAKIKKKGNQNPKREQQNKVCWYDFTMHVNPNLESYDNWKVNHDLLPMEEWIKMFLTSIAKKFSFQLEAGEENGTLHYQGRISLHLKNRLTALVKIFRNWGIVARLSVTSEDMIDNMDYVTKATTRVGGPWFNTDVALANLSPEVRFTPNWYPWQLEVISWIDIYEKRCIDCIISDPDKGKSTLNDWLLARGIIEEITPLFENARDIVRQVHNTGGKHKAYFVDIPMAFDVKDKKKASQLYTAIEYIKSGKSIEDRHKFDRKWNPNGHPRIVIFTNTVPNLSLVAADRWRLWTINKNMVLVKWGTKEPEAPIATVPEAPTLILNEINNTGNIISVSGGGTINEINDGVFIHLPQRTTVEITCEKIDIDQKIDTDQKINQKSQAS